MKYTIAIVLLHYKAYPELKASLKALEKVRKPFDTNVEIVLVDNESSEKELARVKRSYPKIKYLPQKKNIGVPAGFNAGYKYAFDHNFNFIMMLSPDLRMNSDVLIKLMDVLIRDKTIAIASTKMLLKTNPPRIFFVQGKLDLKRKSAKHIGLNEIDKGQFDDQTETDFLNCPLLIRRDVFEKVGYFRTEFFMYYEDIDWYFRIRKSGYKLFCVKDAISWNLQPDKKNHLYPKKEYYNARNLLYFVKWNFSLKERGIAYIYTIKETLDLVLNIVSNKKRKKSYYKLLGMVDFIRGKTGQKIFTNT